MSAPNAIDDAVEVDPGSANSSSKKVVFLLLALALIACGIGVAVVFARQKPVASSGPARFSYATTALKVDDKIYTLQIADTPEKQSLGLGQRENLAPRAGMLFTYPAPTDGLCFWMKDMRFSLDILWLNANKQIIYMEPSLSPATYPHSYCPPSPSQYVVEINAGRAHELGLQTGQKLDF